jgi:hypothetical protein
VESVAYRDHFMAIKWRDLRDVNILNTAHDYGVNEVQFSRGEHRIIKPITLVKYISEIDVDKSHQMQAYYSFPRKSVK